jgi:hypothetical protein
MVLGREGRRTSHVRPEDKHRVEVREGWGSAVDLLVLIAIALYFATVTR